jgi:hypothetical protein
MRRAAGPAGSVDRRSESPHWPERTNRRTHHRRSESQRPLRHCGGRAVLADYGCDCARRCVSGSPVVTTAFSDSAWQHCRAVASTAASDGPARAVFVRSLRCVSLRCVAFRFDAGALLCIDAAAIGQSWRVHPAALLRSLFHGTNCCIAVLRARRGAVRGVEGRLVVHLVQECSPTWPE